MARSAEVGLICLVEDGLYLPAMFCRIVTTLGINRANLSHSLLTNKNNGVIIVSLRGHNNNVEEHFAFRSIRERKWRIWEKEHWNRCLMTVSGALFYRERRESN